MGELGFMARRDLQPFLIRKPYQFLASAVFRVKGFSI